MPWNQNIPQPTDQLSQSQSDILNNFMAIQTLIDVNHVDFNAGADQGKHKWVTFPLQLASPPIVFNAGEEALYNFNNPTTLLNELYVNKQSAAGVKQIPMTASILGTVAAPVVNTSGWTYLPSGLLIKFGNGGSGAAGNVTVNLNAVGPAFIGVINAQVTPRVANLNLFLNGLTIAQLIVNCAIGGSSFNWMVIGY